jgi:hypothetical protein
MKLKEFVKDKTFIEIKEILEKEPYFIKVTDDEKYYILKYTQYNSDMNNDIVKQCRGTILRKSDNKIVCMPFDKFFNYGEENAQVENFDFNSMTSLEKIDGSLLKVWFDEKWHVSTNGTINAKNAEAVAGLCSYYDIFMNAIKRYYIDETLFFNSLNKEYTYLFELVSPITKIVVNYDETDIYYLASIHNETKEEKVFDIRVNRPKSYSFKSLNDIIDNAEKLPFNEEGYVVKDKYNNRLKIKSPAYVAAHTMAANGNISKERLFQFIREEKVDDFISFFPEYKKQIDSIKKEYDEMLYIIEKTYNEIYNKDDSQKEFAMKALKYSYNSALFAMKKGITINDFFAKLSASKIVNFLEKI